jgi:anti-anti-sigma regulatory factor
MLKIEVESHGAGAVIRLIGRIQVEHIELLRQQIAAAGEIAGLDLQEVTLVDLATVRFLLSCKHQGMELFGCSPFIREWMARERNL